MTSSEKIAYISIRPKYEEMGFQHKTVTRYWKHDPKGLFLSEEAHIGT